MRAQDREIYIRKINNLKARAASLREKIVLLKKEKTGVEKELRNLTKIFLKMPAWIVMVQDEKIIFANEKVAKDLGYNLEELIGEKFIRFVAPDFADFILQLHRDRQKGKIVPDEYEGFLITRWGEKVAYEARVSRARYNGRVAFIAVMVPLEKRKRLERERCAKEKLEAIERMSHGVIREIDQCLGLMDTCIKGLDHGQKVTQAQQQELLDGVRKVKFWHEDLYYKLKFLANIHKPVRNEFFSVQELIDKILDEGQKIIQKKGGQEGLAIDLKSFVRTSSHIKGSFEPIMNALLALIKNAVEAMPNGGQIYLTVEQSEGFVNIYLQDSGTGIEKGHEERIFDPFFTTKGEGRMGLGLSLADAIIRRHGGLIDILSHEGDGATFWVKLPIATPERGPKKVSPGKVIKDAKILIISDHDIIHALLCQILQYKGGKIFEAITSNQAQKIMKKKDLDVVIVNMDTQWVNPKFVLGLVNKYQKGINTVFIPSNGGPDKYMVSGLEKPDKAFFIERPLEMNRVVTLISKAISAKKVQ